MSLRSSSRSMGSTPVARRLGSALLLVIACVAGCTQNSVPPYTGILSGVYDLALVNDLLFITSSDKNELRVFDTSITPRDFVRAPNPLEPLSIPVVTRPVGVVRDVHYETSGDNLGAEVGGPYVYAYGAAEGAISVVGADRSLLREVYRLPTTDPVSTVSAHGPDDQISTSRVFFATAHGSEGRLFRVDLPGPDALAALVAQKDPAALPAPVLLQALSGEFIAALAATPNPDYVAVATRSQSGKSGRTYVLRVSDGSMTPLKFPYPVRRLLVAPGDGSIPAGATIWGVLDEESCGSTTDCEGLLAVDASSGEISQDVTGHTMVPIRFGRALPVGLNIAREGFVNADTITGTVNQYALLGMGTTTEGEIFFFDAANKRAIDSNSNGPSTTVALYSADGTAQTFDATLGPQISVAEGAAHDEVISMVKEGVIPGLASLPTSDADGQRFPVPGVVRALADVVAGDVLVVATSSNTDCAELTVASKDTTPGSSALIAAQAVPPECAGRVSFSVRAGAGTPYPYVVYGGSTGYIARTAPNQSFTYPGSYFYHPDNFDPNRPMLSFANTGQEPAGMQRDWYWSITVASGFLSLGMKVDTTYPTLTRYSLPGAITPIPGKSIAFVAYPSASGLIEFNPPLMAPNQANSGNIVPYP